MHYIAREANMPRAILMIYLLCSVMAMSSCSLISPPPYPAPTPPSAAVLPEELAEAPQSEELKASVEDVVIEVDEQKQREKAAVARELLDAFVRERGLDEAQVAALRRWIAWTAYTRWT